jgi:hypothetical protein
MAYNKKLPISWTEFLVSPSALLLQAIRLCILFKRIKWEHSGTTLILVRTLPLLHLRLNADESYTGIQYCDGVRGVLIIKDPDDAYKEHYDGEHELA